MKPVLSHTAVQLIVKAKNEQNDLACLSCAKKVMFGTKLPVIPDYLSSNVLQGPILTKVAYHQDY